MVGRRLPFPQMGVAKLERYNIGDRLRFSITLTDVDGNLSDPDTITLQVQNPSGVTVGNYSLAGGTVFLLSEGVYFGYHLVDAAGVWVYRWQTTGIPTLVEESIVNVIEGYFDS